MELDAAGPELIELAAMAERGECLERGLLSPPLRTACERTVADWAAEQTRYGESLDRALAASRRIATTGFDQGSFQAAVHEFREANDDVALLRPQRTRRRNRAHNAQAQLERDQLLRRQHTGQIEHARSARTQLAELLRTRLAEALAWEWPLPPWFSAALGDSPAVEDLKRWWALAVELLAYRITYRVDDPAAALGQRPGQSACARRRQWFADLDRELLAWLSPGGR